jgi:MFS family permease
VSGVTPEESEDDLSGRSKRRDFTLLWSASAASQLGTMCSTTANPLLALLLTHSPVFAGWVAAASTAPALLMYLPAGWFVDRFNRRRIMFVSQTVRLAVVSLLICALGLGWRVAAVLLLVAALCEKTFQVLYNAAEITAVPRVVDSSNLRSAVAKNEARDHLALMAGRPLGGFLFGLNKSCPYLLSVVTIVWSIIALHVMGAKDYQPREVDRSSNGISENRSKISIFSGVAEVRRHSFLCTAIVVCAIGNFLFQTILLLLVVLAEQQHLSSATIGLLLATSGVGGLAGSALAPMVARWVRSEWYISFCVVIWVVLTFIVAMSGQPVVGLIAWGCLSITGSFLNVAISTYETQKVDGRMFGRVVGINRFITSGVALPLGALSAGYIVAVLQPDTAAWVVFGGMLVMFVVLIILPPPAERPPQEDDRPAGRSAEIRHGGRPRPPKEIRERVAEPVGAQ